ncbi:MAG: potassium channel family protein, partial [Chloroflexota bacterium]
MNYLIVIGGGKVGFYLAQTLITEGYEVLLIEKNPRRCEIISEQIGSVVMNGDGADVRTLESAGASRADVVIATTGDDEDNLIICQVAKKRFEVARTIARVNNPKNEDLFKRLGIDSTVSQTNVIHHMIEQQIPDRHLMHLMTLRHEQIEIVEVRIGPNSNVIGRSLAEIRLPANCVLSAIARGSDVILPTGQTRLEAGDEVIAVTKP